MKTLKNKSEYNNMEKKFLDNIKSLNLSEETFANSTIEKEQKKKTEKNRRTRNKGVPIFCNPLISCSSMYKIKK